MFPNRVGRVILDGVQDPLSHASIPSHFAWAHSVGSVDATFEGFAQDCALAGPSGCPISTNTSTGPGIVEWTRDLVEVCPVVHSHLGLHSPLDRPSTTIASRMGVWGTFAHLWPPSAFSTRPSILLSSGLLLLPAISTNIISWPSKLSVPTSPSQLARRKRDPGQRGSPVRTSRITLSKPLPVEIPSIRATLPPRVSLMSSSASSRMFLRCVSDYPTVDFFSIILTGYI